MRCGLTEILSDTDFIRAMRGLPLIAPVDIHRGLSDEGIKRHAGKSRRYGKWIIATLGLTMALLLGLAAVTIYIDPLFHYHGPLAQFEYPLNNERYQNDGITRNLKYNGLITGSSMTQNFKTSEAETLFSTSFIKVPFSGASYKEIDNNLKQGFAAGKEISCVIRGLDYNSLCADKDTMRYSDYPVYLYNNNLFDDVYYVLNKAILLNQTRGVLRYTATGGSTTTFDEYSNWNARVTFGAEAVLASHGLGPAVKTPVSISEAEQQIILENIRQNVTDLADEHPKTTFYLFFTPYSICFWHVLQNTGTLERQFDIEQTVIEELLKHPNIKPYCFFTNFEMICDLNNYKDLYHYGEWVNSWMLEQMHSGNYLLTEDNYLQHLDAMREFYTSYDYASLHR